MANWCESCLYEEYDGAEEPCINCVKPSKETPTEYFPKRPPKPITNADRIRSMSDEQLAEWLCDIAGWLPEYEGRMHPILEWLKEEATE